MGWLPYRLAGEVAKRVTRDEDLLSTVKLLAGAVFLALAWGLEATVAGFVWGAAVGGADVRRRRRDRLRRASLRGAPRARPPRPGAWSMLRAFHHQTTARLAERRRALADAVARGLRDADADAGDQAIA